MPEINSTSDLTDAFDAVYQEDSTERHRRVVEGYRHAAMAVLRHGGPNACSCVSDLADAAATAYAGVSDGMAADAKQHAANRARVAADRGEQAQAEEDAQVGLETEAEAAEADAQADAEEDESLASA